MVIWKNSPILMNIVLIYNEQHSKIQKNPSRVHFVHSALDGLFLPLLYDRQADANG